MVISEGSSISILAEAERLFFVCTLIDKPDASRTIGFDGCSDSSGICAGENWDASTRCPSDAASV